ncbi:MAG: DNA topoisomerase 3 [Synergistaceae bacterium]
MEINNIKRLFIAEKPSLARAIAEALPAKQKTRTPMAIIAGDDVVCWAAGHIISPLQPDEYGPEYKNWVTTKLPIIPAKWKVKPNPQTQDLLNNIGYLLPKAESVINAGDADREGQLLVDEILQYFKYGGETYRLLVTDMNTDAIKKAIDGMKPNLEYRNVFFSALCRQRADWLFGNNLTRLYSITTQKAWGEKITVGRVQTPTLALVVHRDLDVENFAQHPFYEVKAEFEVENGNFLATWKPKEDAYGLDEKGRIINASIIEKLKEKIINKDGVITKAERKKTQTQVPLPHSLPTLQIEASKLHGISPADTLEIVQNLYEGKLVTYPRSDCQYLPESLYEEKEKALKTMAEMLPDMKEEIEKADVTIKTKAWNTKKVEEHHAIIPTGTKGILTEDARKIYDIIARRYLAQFYPPQEHNEELIEIEIENELFRVRTKRCTSSGWKSLYKNVKEEDENEEATSENSKKKLPKVEKDEKVKAINIETEEKKTSPPERFTEATLIEAMNNIHRFVEDQEIRAVLKETSGIGTAATQAGIIELLKERQYIELKRKRIISTEKGRNLIKTVGEELSKPDTTAKWEMQLKEIEKGEMQAKNFIVALIEQVRKTVNQRLSTYPIYITRKDPAQSIVLYKCPAEGCEGRLFTHNGQYGKYWKCHTCGFSLADIDGTPQEHTKCPTCGKIAVRINGKNGWFWGCKNKECGKTYKDDNGTLKNPNENRQTQQTQTQQTQQTGQTQKQ